MSVQVLSVTDEKGARSVSGLATNLYNMFLTEPNASAALPPPMAPTAPVLISERLPTPAATGCSMNGVTKTVVVIAGVNGKIKRLEAAMERTKGIAEIAQGNGNALHCVFLGGALPPHGAKDEGVAKRLVGVKADGIPELGLKPDRVHLVAGPREIQALSLVASGNATEAVKQYLASSKLVDCLGPEWMDQQGTGGLWVKATGTQGGMMMGKLPGVGVMGANGPRAEWIKSPTPLSPMAWKDELNRRWNSAANDPKALKDKSPGHWQFWMTLGVQSAIDEEALPATGLSTDGCKSTAAFARQSAAFGTVQRAAGQCWMDVGASGDSLYWVVRTWCSSTSYSMNLEKLPALDRTRDAEELQFVVSSTLGSLVQHAERATALTPPVHPWANFGKLRGLLGPCVCGGREGKEVLRVVHWHGHGMPDALMLLPEAYLRYVLHDMFEEVASTRSSEACAVSGFLVLDDADIVPMRVPGVSEAEQLHANESVGARVWKLPLKAQSDAMRDILAAPATLTPGTRLDSTPTRQIFYTFTNFNDPLAGLRVKWVFAPGESRDARDMPTLDVVTD
jgi:hypothetical protein